MTMTPWFWAIIVVALWRKLEEANPFAVAGLLAAIACLRTASNLAERYWLRTSRLQPGL